MDNNENSINPIMVYEKFVKQDIRLHSIEAALEQPKLHGTLPNQSECIDQIAKSLPKAQAEYIEIRLNREGNRGPYANLTPYFEATAPALNKYGCFFYHYSTFIDDKEFLRARILHEESGQWIESHARLIAYDDKDYASFKTKHKRYTMRDVLGIISDDSEDSDDSTSTNTKKTTEKQLESGIISSAQLSKLIELISLDDGARKKICDTLKISDIAHIKKSDYASALTFIKKRMEER